MRTLGMAVLILTGWLAAVHDDAQAKPSGPTLHCGTYTKVEHFCTIKDTGHPTRFHIRYVLNGDPKFGLKYSHGGKPMKVVTP